MSFSVSTIRKAFLIMGKHIQLSNIGTATASQYQGHMMASVAQAVTGVSGEYSDFSSSVVPLQVSLSGFIQAANGIPAVAQAAVDSYLQNALQGTLGLPAGSTSVAVLTSLIAAMNAATPPQTVDPSGNNPNGFFNYFNNTYQVQLPQASPSGTISDTLISSTVQS